jgi:serine/threonine-protein kinase RsbW
MEVTTLLEREVDLPALPSELKTARAFVDDAAAAYGFGEAERYDFTFAANEAVSNAIEHGSPSPQGTIRLRIAEEEGALVLYVWDWGTFAPGIRPPDELVERGRGLALIAALMDEVALSTAGETTLIRLSKRR